MDNKNIFLFFSLFEGYIMINFYNFFYIDKNIVLSLIYLLISSKQVSFVRNDVIRFIFSKVIGGYLLIRKNGTNSQLFFQTICIANDHQYRYLKIACKITFAIYTKENSRTAIGIRPVGIVFIYQRKL